MTFKKGNRLWDNSKTRSTQFKKGSKGFTGKHSEKTKQEHSDFMKEWLRTHKHPFKGKHHTKKSIEKMSNKLKGKKAWNKGKKRWWKSPEFKKGHIPWSKGKKTGIVPSTAFKKGNRPWFMKNYIPSKHPAWQGGISFEPYDKRFNNIFKRRIRKRDNYICMKCGIHQERLCRALDVHHINYDKKMTIPQNCCALCRRCNTEVNANRPHWAKFFQSLLAERYNYQYSATNEIILEAKN